MAEMNNFYFAKKGMFALTREFLLPDEAKGLCRLYGNLVSGGVQMRACTHTSPVEVCLLEDKLVFTVSGSQYALRNMSKDYKEYLEAVEENIPILSYWDLTGNREEGYCISGFVARETIAGKIVSQNKNRVTMDNGVEYFVMWSAWCNLGKTMASDNKKFLDMIYGDDFEVFAGVRCRPILFPK